MLDDEFRNGLMGNRMGTSHTRRAVAEIALYLRLPKRNGIGPIAREAITVGSQTILESPVSQMLSIFIRLMTHVRHSLKSSTV